MLLEAGVLAMSSDDLDAVTTAALTAGPAGVIAAEAPTDSSDDEDDLFEPAGRGWRKPKGSPSQPRPHGRHSGIPGRAPRAITICIWEEPTMAITLARVDDRVIHGQTMTRWVAKKPVDSIIVISDKVAKDELRKKVLKAAAANLKLGIYDVEQGVKALEKVHASNKNFYIISDSTTGFADIVRHGGDFGKVLNIGNLNGARPNTKPMGNAVCLNDDDVVALDYLEEQGVEVQFQLIPDDKPISWPNMKAKYQSA